MRRRGDVMMGRRYYVILKRRYDVPIRRRGDAPLRRLRDVLSRRRWLFHLRRTCDVAATSPRRFNAGWTPCSSVSVIKGAL